MEIFEQWNQFACVTHSQRWAIGRDRINKLKEPLSAQVFSHIIPLNGTMRCNNSLLSVCRTTFGHTYRAIFACIRKCMRHRWALGMICSMPGPFLPPFVGLLVAFICLPSEKSRIYIGIIVLITHFHSVSLDWKFFVCIFILLCFATNDRVCSFSKEFTTAMRVKSLPFSAVSFVFFFIYKCKCFRCAVHWRLSCILTTFYENQADYHLVLNRQCAQWPKGKISFCALVRSSIRPSIFNILNRITKCVAINSSWMNASS